MPLNNPLAPAQAQQIIRANGADYTTTSASLVDVDATNLKIVMTTTGGPVLLYAVFHAGTTAHNHYDFTVDEVRVGVQEGQQISTGVNMSVSLIALVTPLSIGPHTFKLQYAIHTAGQTARIYNGSDATTYPSVIFGAIELPH